jgi:hypothetical protein
MDDPLSGPPAPNTATYGDLQRERDTTKLEKGAPNLTPEVKEDLIFDGVNWRAGGQVRSLDDSDSGSEAMEELGDGNESWNSSSPRGPVGMETSYNMQHILESDTLSLLLSILNAKKVRSIFKRLLTLLKTW